MEKLECESCGKLFSNALILKSHKEQIHRSIFPINSLEKFAKDYREQYDKLFPLRPATPEASPVSSPSPSPPAIPNSLVQQPQQQPVQPIIHASTLSATPATVSIPQVKAPLSQIPLPMELPLFPSLLMPPIPLQALTPQVPVHLPPVEAGLTPDLTQLYQQQLTPAMLHKRSSRTRFTDYQLRVLQDCFDANAYPKDDEFEQLSNLLNLSTRVIVVWFQNARQKARKNYENQGEGGRDSEHRDLSNDHEEEEMLNDLNETA
uniref:Homeobox domain-containing protein n=1 Tax=Sinocyclocheilus rhinocerous TaxID=307959 RepID=A0A673K049_9TELE